MTERHPTEVKNAMDQVRQFCKEDIQRLEPGCGGSHPFFFTAAMISSCAPLFDGLDDNHDVEALLRKEKVIRAGCEGDSESCQMFVNFRTRKSGEAFIDRLNAYLVRRKAEIGKAERAYRKVITGGVKTSSSWR